ncbi:MAG: hypothetical protein E7668_03295 [Ruminococcaceae bacterium]|nr:hypothetical protein [Oscillospiraceae bacterium]
MGNAIVSRYPIVGWRTIGVPAIGEDAEDRVILVAEIDVEGTILTVMNSHFGLTNESFYTVLCQNADIFLKKLDISKRNMI